MWSRRGGAANEFVRVALADPATLAELNDLYDREVLPVFDGLGMGEEARAYRASVIERFRNPFLDHKLADIFTNHAAKKQRRFGGLVALAEQHGDRRRPAAPQGGARGLRRAARRRRSGSNDRPPPLPATGEIVQSPPAPALQRAAPQPRSSL